MDSLEAATPTSVAGGGCASLCTLCTASLWREYVIALLWIEINTNTHFFTHMVLLVSWLCTLWEQSPLSLHHTITTLLYLWGSLLYIQTHSLQPSSYGLLYFSTCGLSLCGPLLEASLLITHSLGTTVGGLLYFSLHYLCFSTVGILPCVGAITLVYHYALTI
jgi:hypothetical protein